MGEYYLYFVFGILSVLLGFLSRKSTVKKNRRCSAFTMGQVVHVERERLSREDDDSNEYTPIFGYYVNGVYFTGKSNISSSRKRQYRIGDPAEILYNPMNPSEFVIKGKSEKSSNGFSRVMFIFGIVLIIIGFSQI